MLSSTRRAAARPPAGATAAAGQIIARSSRAYRWGVGIVRHRRLVLALWLLVLVASGALYPSLQRLLGAPDYLVAGSQSARVERIVETRFPGIGSEQDALVFHSSTQSVSDRPYRQLIAFLLASMSREKGVKSVLGPFDEKSVGQISSDEHSAVAAIALSGNSQQRFDTAARLQRLAGHAAQNGPSGVQAWLTGYAPVARDLVHVQAHDVGRAEAIGLPVALLVLLIALGSLVAALLPLLLAGAGLLVTYGVLAIVIRFSHFDSFLISIVAMVGVGIGIDYALIIVSRYREELARHCTHTPDGRAPGDHARVTDAVGVAMATAGRTIVFSGVICGLAITCMLVLRAAVFREITVGVVAVVACTLLAALTLLPALLGELGSRIERGALPARMQPASARPNDDGRGGWARWAFTVMRRPYPAIAASVAILVLAGTPVLGLKYGLNLGVFALSEAPSGRAEQLLAHSFAPGAVSPARILLTGPSSSASRSDVRAAGALSETLEHDPRVAEVSEQRGPAGVLLDVVTSVAVDSNSANNLIRHVRRDLAPRLHARWGTTVLCGGGTALMLDLAHETAVRFPVVLALILVMSLLFLLVVFRSPLLALKAIVMNLLATGAMLGIVVYVFQDGHGQRLLAFTNPGFIQFFVPLTVFALLYGLSMDYEVFLIRRIQEEFRRTGENRRSVAMGVEHTARPIAAAAAIMVAVFGSFLTASLLELKQLGFAVAAGIAIDATLIRLVLVPALMRVFGAWNWWLPGWLERILPRLEPKHPPVR
jgi:RND superfamily putative drug exporter